MSHKSKNRNAVAGPKEPESWEHLGNPFADLKVDFPPPPPKQEPPPPTKEEQMEADLSKADKTLLAEFRAKGEVQSIGWASVGTSSTEKGAGKLLKLAQQRKGHNGKTVTLVYGFKEFSLEERMLVCNKAKKELGIGARFVEDVLELQGDQRERATKWFEAHGFRCQIV